MADFPIKVVQNPYYAIDPANFPPAGDTTSMGMYQADLIITAAIQAGLADLRANTFLLDYIFAGLARDDLTNKRYGIASIDAAKEWFLNTEIHIAMNYRPVDKNPFPLVSISLVESTEDINTLGDVHYDPSEDMLSADFQVIMAGLTPTYTASTGKLVINNPQNVSLFPGMVVLDLASGHMYPILDMDDNQNLYIQTKITDKLSKVSIVPASQYLKVMLESAIFKEVYSISLFANSQAEHLTFLHSIIEFILLRYRQSFLEARGFWLSRISSGPFSRDQFFDKEKVWMRTITLSGQTRQYWPKAILPSAAGVDLSIYFASNLNTPPTLQTGKEPWDTLEDLTEIE